VTELTAVAAKRDAAVLDKPSRRKALQILRSILRPALSHLRTARLFGQLDGKDVLALWVANQVDNGHVDSHLLLLRDQIDRQLICAESGFHVRQAEVVDDGACICLEAGAERVEVPLRCGVYEMSPSLSSLELRNARPVDDATLLTLSCLVALLITEFALDCWTMARRVAFDAAFPTGARELALDSGIGTVSLVVTDLSTVEALSREAATSRLVGTVTGMVASLVTAAWKVIMMKQISGIS